MASTPPGRPRAGAGRSATTTSAFRPEDLVDDSPVSRQVEAMAAAWRRGERPLAEEILARTPGLRDEDAIRIVYEEACLRQEAGEEGASTEILRRFPQWRSRLALLLDGNRLLSMVPEARFPEVGEDLGDFRLLSEIGRGAAGRTYLASQSSLGDRPVVLKVTALGHEEHLSLARLQHMHIVPLYFEQVIPDRDLRILCMPHLGGTSLSRILEALRRVPAEQRTGRHILEALDRVGIPSPTDEPPGGPFRTYLAQASYVQALCWIGACLADALQYAHDRGLVHMDVKASNVLLAADGQPMLLDFHLARGPVSPNRPPPDRLGGTLYFMAPEQRAAMAAICEGRPIARTVDGRSDLYSLGLLLYEALGGDAASAGGLSTKSLRAESPSTRPLRRGDASKDDQPPRRPLERCNPRVSPGFSDIVKKCLANDPGDRYPDASALAIDLRRHLNDLPLRGVSNRSLVERWRKWRRRRPEALGRGLVRLVIVAISLALFSVWFVAWTLRPRRVENARREIAKLLMSRRIDEADRALKRGLELAEPLPDADERKRAMKREGQRLLKAKSASALHDLVNLLRFRSGINVLSAEEARSLFDRGEEIWRRRDEVTRREAGSLDAETERQIRTDLLDLAIICADLRVQGRSPGADEEEARREAVRILLEAKAQFGPSPALSRDLLEHGKALGRPVEAAGTVRAPQSAWEHYDLGRSYVRSGEYALAEREFRQAVDMQPGEFWPNFFLGVSAYRLGRYHDAVASLSACVALAPNTPECSYNRAMAYAALGQGKLARSDYDRALKLNPSFADAALNRGLLAFRERRYDDATRDLELAERVAGAGRARGRILYNLALVHLARKDAAAARDCLRRAIEDGDQDARKLSARLGTK